MKIIVTGSSGFIGTQVVNYFSCNGYQVIALQRTIPLATSKGVEFQSYDLSDPVNTSKFEGATHLIHTAFQPYNLSNTFSNNINYSGTVNLIEACKKFNIKIIFLSTMSAHVQAESNYGKTKLRLENIFDQKQDLVLKLGLVLGNGGLFGTIVDTIERNRIVPIIGKNKLIQTIAMHDLLSLIEVSIKNNISGNYPIGESNPIRLGTLYKDIAMAMSRKPLFIPVPIVFIYILCLFADKMKIKLPITTENVLGLKKMRSFKTENTFKKFGIQPSSYFDFLN